MIELTVKVARLEDTNGEYFRLAKLWKDILKSEELVVFPLSASFRGLGSIQIRIPDFFSATDI